MSKIVDASAVEVMDTIEKARRKVSGASALIVALVTSPNMPDDDALMNIADTLDSISDELARCAVAQAQAMKGAAEE